MLKGFLNLPWFLWAALAIVVAVVYSFIWPHKAAEAFTGFRFFIIRWGHSLAWLLISINFILRGLSPSLNGMANLIALTGGMVYFLFMAMSFVVK